MINCLIVEDNPLNWMVMKNQADRLGLKVTVCTDGRQALNHCESNPMPELILLDGYMPEMDGVTFLQAMRKLPGGDHPFVVFCSTSLNQQQVGHALDQGAECHFPKPLSRDQIVYALKQVQHRSERMLYNRAGR